MTASNKLLITPISSLSVALWVGKYNPVRAAVCKRMIPDAKVKVCDAYKEVHSLQPNFDIIIIDNNLVQAPNFEHFDLFPAIFKGLKDEGFVIISVCSDPGSYYVDREHIIRAHLGSRVEPFVKDWDRVRAKFYGRPEFPDEAYSNLQGRIMPLSGFPANDMVPVYTALALKAGFFTAYHTVIRRSKQMSYILIELNHTTPRAKLEKKYKDKKERQDAERFKKAHYQSENQEIEYFDLLTSIQANLVDDTRMAFIDRGLIPVKNRKFLWIRHDVDYDLEKAVNMARAEAEYGYYSTYFLLHSAPYWKCTDWTISWYAVN